MSRRQRFKRYHRKSKFCRRKENSLKLSFFFKSKNCSGLKIDLFLKIVFSLVFGVFKE